ncbi:hypothetical protein F4808DRAFT_248135 [Astrocystis sublimbata]|nr:hypothetical protein F4808DRAFT_248135 [Astrocystis sublimbata]
MLPSNSNSPSSSSASISASASAFVPASTSANRPAPASAASTQPGLGSRQGASVVTGTEAAIRGTGTVRSATGTAEVGAGHTPHGPSQQEHCPSPSLDGQSPDSPGSVQNGSDRGSDITSAILQDQRTKKRRIGPSHRGVANLTPEQLIKKRANGRSQASLIHLIAFLKHK